MAGRRIVPVSLVLVFASGCFYEWSGDRPHASPDTGAAGIGGTGGGGTGGAGMAGEGGKGEEDAGQDTAPGCRTCEEWILQCGTGTCSDVNEVCPGPDLTAATDLAVCLCGDCDGECGETCKKNGQDSENCVSCLTEHLSTSCDVSAQTCFSAS